MKLWKVKRKFGLFYGLTEVDVFIPGFDMEDDNEIEFTSFLAATMDVNLGN